MVLTAIYARSANGVIGREGQLPWHIPNDLKRFKALTLGHPMIMGRKTFESFPRPLPGRRHIVLTRDPAWRAEGAEVAHTPDQALDLAGENAFIIGGAEIFRLLLPRCDRVELTEIHAKFAGDTVMPMLESEWLELQREDHESDGQTPGFSFVTLTRARPHRP